MGDVGASLASPQPFPMRQTKYLDPKDWHEKKHFFYRKYFFALFFTFSCSSTSHFSVIFTVFYCILLHFNRIFNRNAASGSPKSLCVTFIGKIEPPDGSLRHARSRTGHQNLFKNVYEQHLWYEKKSFFGGGLVRGDMASGSYGFLRKCAISDTKRPQDGSKAPTRRKPLSVIFSPKSSLRTAWSSMPGVELGIKTF